MILFSLFLAFSSGAGTENPQKIRVLSWNLYNRPWSRAARLENVKRTLIERNPDLVALQEVATGWFLAGDPMKVFESVFPGFFKTRDWHESNAGIFQTGLGLYSRWPLQEVKYTEFNQNPFWDAKGFQQARVEIPGHSLYWFNVHFASTNDQALQQSQLNQLEGAIGEIKRRAPQLPILISGDWNIEWKSAMLMAWLQRVRADSLFSHLPRSEVYSTWSPDSSKTCRGESGSKEGETIDHIAWISGEKPLHWVSGRIGVSPLLPHPSDHCYVESDLLLR